MAEGIRTPTVRCLDDVGYAEAARILAAAARLPNNPLPPPPAPCRRVFRPFTARLRLDPHALFLRAKSVHPDTARAFEVGAWHGRGMLEGCVAVRLRDPTGHPLGYAGRRLDPLQIERRGKWVFPPRLPKGELLYGLDKATGWRDRGMAVVECPWGVLRCAQLSIPAVALLGTHMSTAQQRLLEQAPRLALMMDGDTAGLRATHRLLRRLPLSTRPVYLPSGCDPDDPTDDELCAYLRPHIPS